MTILIVMIGIFGLVGSLSLLIFAPRALSSGEIIQRRLSSLRETPMPHPQAVKGASSETNPLWERTANFFLGDLQLPERYTAISRLLHQAGYPGERTIRIFWGVRIFCTLVLTGFAFFVTFTSAVPFTQGVLFIGASAAVGYLLPFSTVRRKAKLRMRSIRESFPDTLDLLVICVEAGMGIDGALVRVAEEQKEQGLAIGDEFVLMSREIQAGLTRREALARLSDRLDFDELRSLATLLIQTEELGGSIARALRVHADTMRQKRRQKAEEAARKLVIKLLLPMAFCIMPALFLVIFAPPAINIPKIFSSAPGRK
jgi:tight adherence protein C